MASSSTSLRILEVCQVAPAAPAGSSATPTEFSLPLTFFDTKFMFSTPLCEILVFYRLTVDQTTSFHSVVLPRLKNSLSQTLFHFLPLAGNFIWPLDSATPFILFRPEDTVTLTVAESHADFNRLVANQKFLKVDDPLPFLPKLQSSDSKASVLALQVTLFPNKGFSIGFTFQHSLLDIKSFSMLLKAWTCISKHGYLSPELAPSLDRRVVKDPAGLEMAFLNYAISMNAFLNPKLSDPRSLKLMFKNRERSQPNLVRATFELSAESIEKLKKNVLSYYRKQGQTPIEELRLSTYVLTMAYVSVCLVKARGDDGKRKVSFIMPIDCRGARTGLNIPPNYFANCVTLTDMAVEAGEFMRGNGSVAVIAKKLSELVKGLDVKDLLLEEPKRLEKLGTFGPDVQRLFVAGALRLGLYELDIGWGNPEKVSITHLDICGSIGIIDGKQGNGAVEVSLVLMKQEMEAFASLLTQGLTTNNISDDAHCDARL